MKRGEILFKVLEGAEISHWIRFYLLIRTRFDPAMLYQSGPHIMAWQPFSQEIITGVNAIKTVSEGAPFEIVDFSQMLPVACPCGEARRAFVDTPDFPATMHVTDISIDAQKHYHQRHTEVYYFLECQTDAKMELNEEIVPVTVGQAILIRPGTRHRAVGKMKVLILSIPKFDPQDEWVD